MSHPSFFRRWVDMLLNRRLQRDAMGRGVHTRMPSFKKHSRRAWSNWKIASLRQFSATAARRRSPSPCNPKKIWPSSPRHELHPFEQPNLHVPERSGPVQSSREFHRLRHEKSHDYRFRFGTLHGRDQHHRHRVRRFRDFQRQRHQCLQQQFLRGLESTGHRRIAFEGDSSSVLSISRLLPARNVLVDLDASLTSSTGNLILQANQQVTPTTGVFPACSLIELPSSVSEVAYLQFKDGAVILARRWAFLFGTGQALREGQEMFSSLEPPGRHQILRISLPGEFFWQVQVTPSVRAAAIYKSPVSIFRWYVKSELRCLPGT